MLLENSIKVSIKWAKKNDKNDLAERISQTGLSGVPLLRTPKKKGLQSLHSGITKPLRRPLKKRRLDDNNYIASTPEQLEDFDEEPTKKNPFSRITDENMDSNMRERRIGTKRKVTAIYN